MPTMLTGLSCKWKRNEGPYSNILIFLGIFIVFLALRLIVWKNTVLLEDTDSLFYLNNIKTFLTFNIKEILDLSPDSTPFYPFFGALFSLPGWSVETGARLTSLFFSSILFISIYGIGKRIASNTEIFLALIILSFSPILIPFSFSVLTEPSYVATVYFGFWLFWKQHQSPKWWTAVILGIIFGLAFLNRVEGILYIVFIPFFQISYYLWGKFINRQSHFITKKHLTVWTLIYIACFSLVVTPQIWRVSHKMGTPAINGRQIWSLVLNNTDGRSNNEKIFGLDYSPGQLNMKYIQSHPETLNNFKTEIGLIDYIRTAAREFNKLYQKQIGILIGPLGLIFFGFGLLSLLETRRLFELFLILSFIVLNLIAPLLYNVAMRHIVIIAPIMILIEGIGIYYFSDKLLNALQATNLGSAKITLSLISVCCLFAASTPQLWKAFKPSHFNQEYSPAELSKPADIIVDIVKKELFRPPNITAQRGYLSHLTGGKQIYLPYTDYKGLVEYCELNNVDFLYLKHRRVKKYPLLTNFLQKESHPDFTLLYNGVDAFGEKIELFRFY